MKNNDHNNVHQTQDDNAWAELEYKQRENIKKYQAEIIESKNTITELKT